MKTIVRGLLQARITRWVCLATGREGSRIITDYSLWFLNKYLKGSTDAMPALKDYPRVINFKDGRKTNKQQQKGSKHENVTKQAAERQ